MLLKRATWLHSRVPWLSREGFSAPVVYIVMVLCVVAAWLVRLALDPYLGNSHAFSFFYVAVALMAWWLDWRPALVALVLGYLAGHWFFLPPRYALWLEDFADVLELLTYFFVGGVLILAIHSLREAQHRASANAQALLEEKRELENEMHRRQQAEDQLRFQLQLIQSITSAAAVSIFVTDENGRVTMMNPEAERTFGFSLGELRGKLMHDAIHHHYPDGRLFPQSECPMGKVYTSGETTRGYEELFFRKDGSTLPVMCANAALWVGGKIAGAVLVAQDITERKRTEEALARSREELERLVRERTAKLRETVGDLEHFSYSLMHDMRAPLRAMQSYALLAEQECVGCTQALSLEYLRRIKTVSQRMDNLITDALNYSKILRQDFPLHPVALSPLIRSLLESYPELQLHQAEIHLAPSLPVVLGNEAALTECFSNLLRNAVKFVAPGVTPNVRVWAEVRTQEIAEPPTVPTSPSLSCRGRENRREESANASRTTHHDSALTTPPSDVLYPQLPTRNQFVRLWVEDNGIGIPKGAQQKLFGMFQRMHCENEYPGTGIGLAIVRKVAERIGGHAGVESEEGKGSRFWVELAKAP